MRCSASSASSCRPRRSARSARWRSRSASTASALGNLLNLIATFYATCALFVFVVLGLVALFAGFSMLRFIRYIREELLIVLGTSSSESALPRLMDKLERLGCSQPGRRPRGADRLFVQSRRHQHLHDAGVAVHRAGADIAL